MPRPQSSPLINKNITRQETHRYLYTSMVSHRGTPVSFAMREDGRIFYSVLDLNGNKQQSATPNGGDPDNDKNCWSKVQFDGAGASQLHFPTELSQVGYQVVPNFQVGVYDSDNEPVIKSFDEDGKPLDAKGKVLTEQAIKDQTDLFYSSTAKLGAKAPFQVLSDAKYIYVFRQSVSAADEHNEAPPIVDNTLLVDRFILSGSVLKLSREIRYQRSKHKTEPASRKDTLSPVDIEGNPFYEPTRELAFADKLSDGNFSVLLIPGADTEEQRWQIFTVEENTDDDGETFHRINSYNVRFDYSIVFDMTDSQLLINEFIDQYELDGGLVVEIQEKIKLGKTDSDLAADLSMRSYFNYNSLDTDERLSLRDALAEVAYGVRTGVSKDDFLLESSSEWPLIEYEEDGSSIKSEYLRSGVLQKQYRFQAPTDTLKPHSSPYSIKYGISSCYYYQQELGPDGKPMKNKACVMLALGLEDHTSTANKYLGILNFAVSAEGRLSRLTTDAVNLPDINVQALDENPYETLEDIPTDDQNRVAWQRPQKMRLLDIDPNGLSTSGGVLKFAFTSAEVGESGGYSDAVTAKAPYLFDDSLGRVNLYFQGGDQNFFVLYFNPTGSKSIGITDVEEQAVTPSLSLKPRLDRDMNIDVVANLPSTGNTCELTLSAQYGETVELWDNLPRRISQIAAIMNGQGELPLGKLEPLGLADDLRAAYLKPGSGKGQLMLRTTKDNNIVFQTATAYAQSIADGATYSRTLSQLSRFLTNNKTIQIAKKTFLLDGKVEVSADQFHQSYLAGIVTDVADVDKLWSLLKEQELVKETEAGPATSGYLRLAALRSSTDKFQEEFSDDKFDALGLELLKEGNQADKKARRAKLRQDLTALILDVAKIRLLRFEVQDDNADQVDRLGAGLSVTVGYDYSNFRCTPGNLGGASAAEWEHQRSYLFDASVLYEEGVDAKTEIEPNFKYSYNINNTIGQWEDWNASLALELKPTSATKGSALHTSEPEKLQALKPTEKGLSVEAWVKPSESIRDQEQILYYRQGEESYGLGLEKHGGNKYRCVATLGRNKYRTRNVLDASREKWHHLAFTHKKYWGYHVGNSDSINCGNDNSLQLDDEFTIELLVKPEGAGTLVEKMGEYKLSINNNREISFECRGENYLLDPKPLPNWGHFYKITLIRSRNKPQADPTKAEYPITGEEPTGTGGENNKDKWYEDKDTDEIIKGMAEKQDQLDNKFDRSQSDLFGDPSKVRDAAYEANPTYYHTLIVTKSGGNPVEWVSPTPFSVTQVEEYQDFVLGSGSFMGTFDSLRVWGRPLSKKEAGAFALPDSQAGLISHWRMAEGKGKYLYDETSENHGVAQGGKWVDSPRSNQADQFLFYIDGAPEACDTEENVQPRGVDQFCLGGIKTGDSKFQDHLQGCIEEVRVWNLPRTNEQITDNAFGRLKGEWEQLLANYTFDIPIKQAGGSVQDSSMNTVTLEVHDKDMLQEVLSTAPIATEIPQVRSALTGVLTEYNGSIRSEPAVVEYGDVQRNDDGTLNGILKRCYSFIDKDGAWNRMTGYKVGNLISQWFSQAQFAPQVMGYLEGPAPVPAENFPIGSDRDIRTYAYSLDNSINFQQAEEVSYNYSTSKEAGWNVALDGEMQGGLDIQILLAPFGFGISTKAEVSVATASNWETSGNRSESYERGTSVNTERAFGAALPGFDNGKTGNERYYKLSNTGFALVKSKTADIYLLRLAHNDALVSIFWQPNPDIPEDVNILPFPINPLYVKQGTLDGKFGETTDDHYPQAHGAYGEYSYFKPREAYRLKKQIEREKMQLKAYFEDSFDVTKANGHFAAAAAATGAAQLGAFIPAIGAGITSVFNQTLGQVGTQVGYNRTQLKDDLAKMGSQRNLVNNYVWTIEGGFYSESTEIAETQQETYAGETALSLGGGLGVAYEVDAAVGFEQKTLFSSGSSFTLTKSRTKESSTSFGLDVNVDIPTSARYQYGGADGRSLVKGLIAPGVVDAYRFMSFYLEPKGSNFVDLFTKVIDPIWLDESPDPNAQALRQARGNIAKAKPCWRIMHRVTYVSRILPEFQPEAPPSLEKAIRVAGIESNYMLIKKFEPYLTNISDQGTFFTKIDEIIEDQLPEFNAYKRQIKYYLALYFNIDQQ